MQIKKSHLLAILAAIAALLSACGPAAGAPANTNPPQNTASTPTTVPAATPTVATGAGLCANPLVPVTQGATWTYTTTAGSEKPFSFSTTITSVRQDGFTVATKFDDNTIADQEWACKPEGLLALSMGAGQGALGLSMAGVNANITTSNPTGVTVPSKIDTGMKWPYAIDMAGTIAQGSLSAALNGAATTEFQALGTESVTVPAGTFDATKIQATSTIKVAADYHGLSLPITSVITTTFWFAPGVGWVKSAETGELLGTSVSGTTELQSLSIP